MLIRYWFEFEFPEINKGTFGTGLGFGVTAYSYDDAVFIIKKQIFTDCPFPAIKKVIENIDVSKLDAGHVLPNMLPPNLIGI